MKCLAFLICFTTAAVAADDQPSFQQSINAELSGALDNVNVTPAEQIEAATARARQYIKSACTDDDVDAIKASLKRSIERILDRARQKVKDAQQRLEDVKDKANQGATAA